MRCRTCGYALWGITTGRCPECDRAFKPSDYQFKPRAVAFTCTKCGASYAGTSASGHLVPAEFDCAQCGTALAMDAMVVSPAPGVAEADTMQAPNPWMDRQRVGVVKAFFAAIVAILFEPARFMRAMLDGNPADGTVRDAIKFAGCVMVLAYVPLFLLGLAVAVAMFGAGSARAFTASSIFFGFIVAFVPIWLLVFPLVMSLIGHGALALAGASRGGLGRTAQCTVYCYAAMAPASFLLGLVPLGGLVALGWQCWSLTVLLREAHRTTTARALVGSLAAVFVPILTALALVLSLFVVGFSMASARAASSAQVAAAVATSRIQSRAAATSFAEDLLLMHDETGAWPLSPLDAVAAGRAEGAGFLAAIRVAPDAPWSIGGASAEAIAGELQPDVAAAAKLLTWELPKNGLPFRIGDTTFLYGVSDGDLDDWMFVHLPTTNNPEFVIFTATGSHNIEADRINEELAGLNASRARRRLPPLDDPRSAPYVTGKSDMTGGIVR